jgi:glycosyltransferase involved in cell wall biosynthesis
MRISIIIPSFNNLEYLAFTINSLQKNSFYNHEIIIHINDGSDGSLDYVKKNNFFYTFSYTNIGLCSAVNIASLKSTTNYIFYSHDDMFYSKNWDLYLEKEVNKIDNKFFYLSGTTVSIKDGLINCNFGFSPSSFDEVRFNQFCKNDNSQDLQGSHWAPHLIHKDLWLKIGGFSEEFNPGDGSDPDMCMKLWLNNVRIFKCISKLKVYHFSSITTRKSNVILNKGTKTFLLKYGFNPRFFREHYLKGNGINIFQGKLSEPKISYKMAIDLVINRFKFLYFKILTYFK